MASPPKFQRAAFAILQVAITGGILWALLHDGENRRHMGETLARARLGWMLAGVAVYGAVEMLAALRWKLLLHVQGIAIHPVRVWVLLLIAVFFNFVIPGGSGGDVVRMFYLLRETPGRKSAAVLSVVFDLVVGLFALVLLAGVFITFDWPWLTSTAETRLYVLAALAILAVSAGVVVFSFVACGREFVRQLPTWLPGRDRVAELALAYQQYARAWKASLAAVAGSMLCQLGYFLTFYCAARALQTSTNRIPSLGDLFTIMPVVNTITSLPISVGGLGVREGLLQVFLGRLCGIPASVAFAISSLGFLLTAVWGAIGGILYLCYRPSEHAHLRTIRAEVAKLEHTVAAAELNAPLSSPESR